MYVSFDYGLLPLLDVLLVVLVLHVDLFLQNVEKQNRRRVHGILQHFQTLVKGAHLQLHLVILDQGNARLKKIEFSFQHEVVPHSKQELATLEAIREERQKPPHQEHTSLQS